MTVLGRLELDLDVFAGPFDLLLSLVLRDELDLLEVELADVVLAYLDHLEAREGALDLEATTEFLVLIAALLELKSRLMLPGDEEDEEDPDALTPVEAAEELLERLVAYARYRGAAGWLAARGVAEQGVVFRAAPLPAELRRARLDGAEPLFDPARLGQALGGLLRVPPPIDVRHVRVPTVTMAERLAHLRALLRRGRFAFEDAVRGADRQTVAMTLFALLELYKRGEAGWEQAEPFGPITVEAA